ncbi:MAG: hypothetical protein HPY79_06710 [Bacteroidales bacterium]|nr:hypothetical protein [Bacteroidales bacterium]
MYNKLLILFTLLLTLNILWAQNNKTILLKVDTNFIVFDSIPISPFNFQVFDVKGQKLSNKQYEVNFIRAAIRLKNNSDSIILKYSHLSSQLPFHYFHKSKQIILKDTINWREIEKISYSDNISNPFNNDELIKRGSISRGISIGNNQNASVTSSLNLQLSGKLGKDFQIIAALTDQQVPFQPSGNTQQINDFDKIFIQIFNKKNQIILGDYDLINKENTFMPFSRKAQGIEYSFKNNDGSFLLQTSNSVSKGKYNRMVFNGKEGIQGPYKLSGVNQEPYIVIIAGTEHVYIDGKLLVRGENNDYIIDYNTAELTFTAKNPINKDSRIAVEFEYSDRNYARFLTYNKVSFKKQKSFFQFQIFHEFDAKNQPLQQSLSDEEKKVLSFAGNNEWKAVVPYVHYDSVLNSNTIYYRLQDTLVNGVLYDSIFVYSTDSLAHFNVGFTFVGKGNGNYVQASSQANGRVYKWVAPINGIKQGDFEPVRKLIAPIKKTIFAGSYQFKLFNKSLFLVEAAISDFDKNLFSSIDNNLNQGFAIKTSFWQSLHKNDSSKHQFYIKPYVQWISEYFQAPERYKSVEFERDWNFVQNNTVEEKAAGIENQYHFKNIIHANIGSDYLQASNIFKAYKEYANFEIKPSNWLFQHKISYLNTKQQSVNTSFLKYKTINERYFSLFKLGADGELEQNQWKKNNTDSLLTSSFQFYRWNSYFGISDTNQIWGLIRYGERTDLLPLNNRLTTQFFSRESAIEVHIPNQKHWTVNTILTYRQLTSYYDSIKPIESNLTSHIDLGIRFAKNAISLSTMHESNAGLEPKLSYTYLEVPPGKGIYTWIDYNQNGIKELNEFEIAQFSDQATFIRITSPTTEYIKVYGSRLSQTLNLRPELFFQQPQGLKKIFASIANQTVFQQDLKTQSNNLFYRIIPFNQNDSMQLLLNHLIRNTFSINKTNNHWGIDFIFQQSNNSQLLINGIDKRQLTNYTLSFRWNINTLFTVFINPTKGQKIFTSAYFNSKNFNIHFFSIESSIAYQSNKDFRLSSIIKQTEKNNTIGNETTTMQSFGIEMRKNINTDNFLSIKIELVKNKYYGNLNTSIAYELLEGLQPGWNQIYSIQLQRNISSTLQMLVSYQGRDSESNKMIHTGNVELRAWF